MTIMKHTGPLGSPQNRGDLSRIQMKAPGGKTDSSVELG